MAEGFSENAQERGGHAALVYEGATTTYGELDDRTDRLAAYLAEQGIGRGDRVAACMPNHPAYFETALAAGKLGANLVPVNYHLRSEEVAYVLQDAEAKVVVTHTDVVDEVDEALEQVECLELVVGSGDDRDYEQAIAGVSDAEHRTTVTMASPVLYTSGTTGRPKGVVHGYEPNDEIMRMNMQGQAQLWGWSGEDVYILSGPAYHGGPGGYAMAALFVGATVVVLPHWDARRWIELVEEHGVTISFMVPAHFIRLLELGEDTLRDADLDSLRIIVHAGAPCPVSVKERIMDALPCEIHEMYGMSEGGATKITPEEWRKHPGSVGTPWPGIEIKILDEDGNEVPTGEEGLIHVTPMAGVKWSYHGDDGKTDDAWAGELYSVGDIGRLDEDGYLYITDRASDMVIRGGVNIYPREIEECLHTHPDIVDCAVFGIPDERMGEELMAVVEAREGLKPDDIRAHVAEHLADYKIPREVELVDELPRNPNGKVMKRLLRAERWEGQESAITTS